MENLRLPAIPAELHWMHQPLDWQAAPDGSLTIVGGPSTNWFIDPSGNRNQDSAPGVLFTPPDANFLLSTRVKVAFAAKFDAGVIQIRAADDLWAKLCFEYSPQGQAMIVSVVTRGFSDDCNSDIIPGNEVYLRAAVTPQTIAFHYSRDGRWWNFVRYFTIGKPAQLQVGFAAQSPWGQQCAVVFSEMRYQPGVLLDRRNGD